MKVYTNFGILPTNGDNARWHILAVGFIGIRFVDSFFVLISVLTPEMEKRMEKTIGMRIKECRVKMGMTQDELAEALLTKKSIISAYENDKIDIKISILKQIAKELDTTVFYLAGEQDEDISNEVMQMAMVLQQIQSRKLRMVAIEQVKVLAVITESSETV